MSGKVESIVLLDKDRELRERFQRGQKAQKRLVFRASVILAWSSGKMVKEIASELHTRPNTVIQWRDRYLRNDIKGLYDDPKTGKPNKYPTDLKARIVELKETDPQGHAV